MDGSNPPAAATERRHSTNPDDPFLAGLTPPQQQAVLHDEGPLLILAAAGSGKTRVITRRIARLISTGTPPWRILALTFTNKAAGEMRERVLHQLLGEDADPERVHNDRRTRGLTITTFHSLCARLLRRYAEVADLPGLKPDYTIYPTGDQMTAMKSIIAAMGMKTSNWPPRSVLSAISNAKNELLDADAFAARANDYYTSTIAKLYKAYQQRLRTANAVDFDDLLLLTCRMLRERDDIRRELSDRWRYLLIDEYQDTNRAQFEIARLLAGEPRRKSAATTNDDDLAGIPGIDLDDEPAESDAAGAAEMIGPNICVVGDPDQSIYGWRGADITNILEFETQYPSTRVIMLGQNFRSTEPILSVADTLIKHNKQRKDKPLYTSSEGGEPVEVTLCRDERHEAELIADWFRALRDAKSAAWKDMAVFYRTNALSRVLEDAFRQHQIPYIIARGTAFFEREEVRNAVAYLKVVANTADDVSLERIINTPARGIGKTTLNQLQDFARAQGIPLIDALRRASELGLAARTIAAIQRFLDTLDGWTGAGTFMGASVSGTLHELTERVIKESALEAHYTKQAATSQSESDAERLDNLAELVSSARAFEDEYDPANDPAEFPGVDAAERSGVDPDVPPLLAVLRGYLESVALVADSDKVDPANGAVTLMTLHAAKGLEFPAVAMVGLEEGLLPHSRAFESETDLEEERRLAFVGVTRAMQQLRITSAKYRTVRGMHERTIPSRFLNELGKDHVRMSDQSDEFDDDFGRPEREFDASPASRGGSALAAQLDRAREQRRERSTGKAAQAREQYPVGSIVRHPQFGEGEVLSISGGQHVKAQIRFYDVGPKTLVLEYARLTRVR